MADAAKMIARKFGWTGRNVAVVGQGTWMIEGSPEKERNAVEAMRAGLDLGLTHIDTAEMYGNGRAEELVAEAISGRREEVFLASKVLPYNASHDGTLRACERSLKRLKTTYIDLYMLHWKGRYPIADTMRAMERLVSEGSVRYIGVSNFDTAELKATEQVLSGERLACDQVLYHLDDRGIERNLIPYCGERQIAVVGYSPFGHGSFPDPVSPGGAVLAAVAARHNATPRQVVLNFLTRIPSVFAIPKTGKLAYVRENAGALSFTLTPSDIVEIEQAFPAPDHDTPLGMI